MVWRRFTDRLMGRGPDAEASDALFMRLSQYSIDARRVSDEQFRALRDSEMGIRGMRLVAAAEIDQPPLRFALITRVSGEGAAHSGQVRATGAHVLVDSQALPAPWSGDWTLALRATPVSSERELGAVREFQWRSRDASDPVTADLARWLAGNDRVQRRVLGLLRDGGSGQFEIVPLTTMIRIGVYQYGLDLPDPTAFDALVAVAQALEDDRSD